MRRRLIYGISEIADELGAAPATISKWYQREKLPEPTERVACGTVAEAVKAGADGYVSKSASREFMLQAIQDVAAGRSVLDPNVTEGVFGRILGREGDGLSDRELAVLQELTYGRSTREVAERIHVSEETVKTYLTQIYRKLSVKDRTEAVAEAFRRGFVH